MMKTIIFKALALGLLSHALISGPADAGCKACCPAFNLTMVDAAAMASDMVGVLPPTDLIDNSKIPRLHCEFFTTFGRFNVEVNDPPSSTAAASLSGANVNAIGGETALRASKGALSVAELHACRVQVLQSFVWNQHCAPFLP